MVQLHTDGWEGFDWDNVSIPGIPQEINHTDNIPFTYMIGLESLRPS